MKFEVIGVDGCSKMSTEHGECIPWADINHMESSGYSFRVDGKVIKTDSTGPARTKLLKLFNLKAADVPKIDSKPVEDTQKAATVTANPNTKPIGIKCVESGIVYPTQSAAAKDVGIDPAQVSDSIKTGKQRSGYTFVKVYEE